MKSRRESVRDPLIAAAVFVLLACGWWALRSHYEAAAFERITGQHVTTWEAMFVELRVQEPAR